VLAHHASADVIEFARGYPVSRALRHGVNHAPHDGSDSAHPVKFFSRFD